MAAEYSWNLARVISIASLALAGCGDLSGTRRITGTFTPCEIGTTLAYQPKGGVWTDVPRVSGAHSFLVPERIGVVITELLGSAGGRFSRMYFMTEDEFIVFASLPCSTAGSVRFVSGSIAGVPADNTVRVTASHAVAVVDPSTPAFSLVLSRELSVDVVATRQGTVAGQTQANSIIIRRGVALPDGATIPTLSFNGSEAQNLTTGTITLSGLASGEFGVFAERYYTGRRSNHVLVNASGVSNGSRANVGVPGGLADPADFYIHSLTATVGDDTRSTIRFDEGPTNLDLALGPALSTVTFGALSTAPFGRVEVTVPGQSAYPSFATAWLWQTNSDGLPVNVVEIIVTAGYLGLSPTTWELEMPDLAQVPGYPSEGTFVLPGSVRWFVSAYAGPIAAYFGVDGIAAGTVARFAKRTGTTQF